jgi:hypothetical protein
MATRATPDAEPMVSRRVGKAGRRIGGMAHHHPSSTGQMRGRRASVEEPTLSSVFDYDRKVDKSVGGRVEEGIRPGR